MKRNINEFFFILVDKMGETEFGNQETPELYIQMGKECVNQHMLEEGEKYFKLALDLDNNSIDALNELGKLYDMCQNDKEAEEFYNRALEIDKKHVKTHVNLCIMKFHQYKEEEALKGLRNLVKENPNDVNALQNLAKVLSLRGWDNEAMEIFLSALELEPNNPRLNVTYAVFLEKIFSLEQSEAHFKKAIDLEPNNPNHYISYGYYLYRQFRDEEAKRLFQTALQIKFNDVNALFGLAELNLVKENINEAEQILKKTVEINPKFMKGWTKLSEIYNIQKKMPEANNCLKQARLSKPKFARKSNVNAASSFDQRISQRMEAIESEISDIKEKLEELTELSEIVKKIDRDNQKILALLSNKK